MLVFKHRLVDYQSHALVPVGEFALDIQLDERSILPNQEEADLGTVFGV